MSELPFLVVHGFWVWLVVFLGFAAVLGYAMHWLHLRGERKNIEATVAMRAAKATGPVEGASTLRGILRGGGASTLTYEGKHGVSGREPGIWLDCAGERIELDGPIHVAAGRKWRYARRGVPRGTPSALREAHRGESALAMVGEGDEVIVEGELSLVADRAEHTHRELAGKWVVRPPSAAASRIQISSTKPAAPTAISRWGLALVIASSLVVSQVSLGLLGRTMFHRTAVDEAGNIPFAFSISVAIPNSRLKALEKLQYELMMHGMTTPAQDRRVLAVDELRNRIF